MKLTQWDPENSEFWSGTGKRIANRNLWISIPNLLLGFAVWMFWGVVIVRMQGLHDANPALYAFTFGNHGLPLSGPAYKALLYTLPAVAGLTGATLRIPNSFVVAIAGGRNAIFATTSLLILPALGTGLALRQPGTSFLVFVVLAALSGIGGGAFAASMSNISFFFPKRMQGLSLGLNAGIGNLGVAVMQLLVPIIITFGVFGGTPNLAGTEQIWLENSGFVWVPILVFLVILVWFFMDNLPFHNFGSNGKGLLRFLWLECLGFAGAAVGIILLLQPWGGVPEVIRISVILLVSVLVTLFLLRRMTPKETKAKLLTQFEIFGNKHNWVMTYLYTMTFGSFIGYSNAFPKLLKDVFGYIRVDASGQPLAEAAINPNAPNILKYAFLGAAMGALIRPVGGWLSDKFGGARVTHWSTLLMIVATLTCGYTVARAGASATPETFFWPFLLLFVVLFGTTGVGNGSTFRMIAVIFSKDQAGPVLGWTSAIAAYGSFLIPIVFANQIKANTPQNALYGFALYYLSCLILNWWFYARKNAEKPC